MLIQEKYNYGVIILRKHTEARPSTELKVQSGEFKKLGSVPIIKILHSQFNALVEGIEFKLTSTGEIKQLM
jgi:CRISPR-associated endonuclease Csn1